MRKKKLFHNTISSITYQIIAIICGFILPKLILTYYSSDVNGLVNSISEFLRFIAILDLGVGAVVCSSLYKPLANKDEEQINKIMTSANKYFKTIGYILIVYIIVLPFIFYFFITNKFSFIYTLTLIISISISYLAQYLFGIVNQQLINADQKGYIQYNLQSITLILNTVLCSVLIINNASIQIVKLTTSLVFLLRPIFLQLYVRKNYNINKKCKYKEEPIKQKWNGLFQHLTAVVLDSTDTIVLSIFSTLSNVSVYSVYFLVIHAVRQLIQSITNGLQSLLGNIIANEEKENLTITFSLTEWSIHTISTFAFGCVMVMIVPFVKIYTSGINDANYVVPTFGILITLAHLFFCYRLPYHLIIKASGKYKETQNNYLIAMILNIVISIVLVQKYGLIGVAIGTLVAMLYQTIGIAFYCSKNVVNWPLKKVFKQLLVDSIVIIMGFYISRLIITDANNYISFIIQCIKVSVIFIIISSSMSFLLYRDNIKIVLNKIKVKK